MREHGLAAAPPPAMTRAEVAELLAARIPGLGTDEVMQGGDSVAALCELYEELRGEGDGPRHTRLRRRGYPGLTPV